MKTKNLISGLVFAAVISIAFAVAVPEIHPALFAIFCILSALAPTPRGVLKMALQKEIWQKDVVDNLYKDNQFALFSYNADQFVLQGKVVHIPNAGTPGAVKKNITEFPQAVTRRADQDVTYAIDTFYLLPRHIEHIEKYELSYDKRQSMVGEDQTYLIQYGMDSLLYRWGPLAAKTVLTDGDNVDGTLPGTEAGQRKSFHKRTFTKIALAMDNANVPKAGRVCLMTANHYYQFFESLTDGERTNVGKVADLEKGIVGKYMGIQIMMRSTVLRYRGADGAYVVVDEQAEGFAGDADDRAASLFWHKDSVEKAFGEVKMFDNPNQAEYFGDVYSMLLRLGGRIRRPVGVWAAVEALAA